MIRTLDDRFLKHVKELKVGDVFRTNRNGKLRWSPWFIALGKPRWRYHTIPRKGYRYEVISERMHQDFYTDLVSRVIYTTSMLRKHSEHYKC